MNCCMTLLIVAFVEIHVLILDVFVCHLRIFIIIFLIFWSVLSIISFQWRSVLFCYEISIAVSFIPLRDLNDCQFCFIMRFQWRLVLFLYRISMTDGSVPLQDFSDGQISSGKNLLLRDFNHCQFCFIYEISVTACFGPLQHFDNGQFCSFMRFQWWSVLFRSESSIMVVFFSLWDLNDCRSEMKTDSHWDLVKEQNWIYKISVIFKDGQFHPIMRFKWQSVLFRYKSLMIGFVPLLDLNGWRLCIVMRSQWRLVLFHFKISMTVCVFPFWDFNNGRFCFIMRFQWRSVLFRYEISVMVVFVSLWDLNDWRFCSFVPLRDFKDSWFCSIAKFLWWLALFLY